MKQLMIIFLLLTGILCFSGISSALERGTPIRIKTAAPKADDDINPTYRGKWGWHKVHKKTVKKVQNMASSPKKDVCARCHKKSGYKIYDPHTQLSDKGDIINEKCLYCHPEKPDEKSATYTTHRPEIKFVRQLDVLCLGCHSKQYDDGHPVNAKHICKPSNKMHGMMKESEKQYGIILPLNHEGKIMCATCHNPHERGVIPTDKSSAKGASELARVRLIGTNNSNVAPESDADITVISTSDGISAVKAISENYRNMTGQAKLAVVKKAVDVEFRITGNVNTICLTCHKDKSITGFSRNY